ncbi:EpsG family protein [Colwellia sp. RE-S-Sl-9]
MLPYIFIYLLSLSFMFIGHHFKFNKIALNATYIVSAIPLIILTGFKHAKVGTDSPHYIYYYNYIDSVDSLIGIINVKGEPAFWVLNYLGRLISDNYVALFSLSSIIITSCYFYSIKQFNLKTLSLATLLLIGPYLFQINGTRQAIAIAIFSVSVIFIINKQPIRYLLSILIGCLFHKSIIICLPLYFIFKGEIKPRKIGFILFFFLIFVVFFPSFISIASSIDSKYSTYGDQQETSGGVVVSTFNILLFVWFVLCRRVNARYLGTRSFDILLSLYLLGTLISLLSIILRIDPSGFLRMSIYFIQLNMFLLPMTIISFKDYQTRLIMIFVAIIFMSLYFYLTTSTFSNLAPYRFNPIVENL